MLQLLIHFAAGALCLGWYSIIKYWLLPRLSEESKFTSTFARFIGFGPALIFGFWYLRAQIASGVDSFAFLIGAFAIHEVARRMWQQPDQTDPGPT